jgi:uncharacterized protein (TIGR03083 family)
MSEKEAAAYRAVRERTSAIVREARPEVLDETAPATPKWRVRDVLAHMVGVTADAVAGRLDGVATDPWTAAQVDARRSVSVSDMLAEWDEFGPQFEATLAVIPEGQIAAQAVLDAITHEQDIRHALAVPGGRDSDAIAIAFDFCRRGRTVGGLPAIRVISEQGEAIAGTGDPIATLETSRFEFIRASTGRRCADEVRAYQWHGMVDPEIILVAPIFTMRPASLHE